MPWLNTEVQVLNDCVQYTDAHMVAVSSPSCMVSGFGISIPKRNAHIYTLSKNSVMCLVLRRSAITGFST